MEHEPQEQRWMQQCPLCDYNLHTLPVHCVCPECGTSLDRTGSGIRLHYEPMSGCLPISITIVVVLVVVGITLIMDVNPDLVLLITIVFSFSIPLTRFIRRGTLLVTKDQLQLYSTSRVLTHTFPLAGIVKAEYLSRHRVIVLIDEHGGKFELPKTMTGTQRDNGNIASEIRRQVRQTITGQQELASCVVCGYPQAGFLAEANCPECGTPFHAGHTVLTERVHSQKRLALLAFGFSLALAASFLVGTFVALMCAGLWAAVCLLFSRAPDSQRIVVISDEFVRFIDRDGTPFTWSTLNATDCWWDDHSRRFYLVYPDGIQQMLPELSGFSRVVMREAERVVRKRIMQREEAHHRQHVAQPAT